jgi:general stress protein 26
MSELLWRIVDSVRFPLLVTQGVEGFPVARPMHLLERNGSVLWFATSAVSAKVGQIHRDPRVTVVFSRPDLFNYASVYGRARLTAGNRQQRRRLWRDEWSDHWRSAEDEDYLLLSVTGERASYYYGYMDRHEEIALAAGS